VTSPYSQQLKTSPNSRTAKHTCRDGWREKVVYVIRQCLAHFYFVQYTLPAVLYCYCIIPQQLLVVVAAAHDAEKAVWMANTCKYVIVDGHHRFNALRRLQEEFGDNVSAHLAPKKVQFLGCV
jgi:hypothetical protein